MAKIEAVEKCLVEEWEDLVSGLSQSDRESVTRAHNDLASTIAYLLNFFLEPDPVWRGFSADDLLDAEYGFPSSLKMSALGLMCWGANYNYLSPFFGEFERDPRNPSFNDFKLYFAASSPDNVSFTIPYTRDKEARHQLLMNRPQSSGDWAHIFKRSDLLDVAYAEDP